MASKAEEGLTLKRSRTSGESNQSGGGLVSGAQLKDIGTRLKLALDKTTGGVADSCQQQQQHEELTTIVESITTLLSDNQMTLQYVIVAVRLLASSLMHTRQHEPSLRTSWRVLLQVGPTLCTAESFASGGMEKFTQVLQLAARFGCQHASMSGWMHDEMLRLTATNNNGNSAVERSGDLAPLVANCVAVDTLLEHAPDVVLPLVNVDELLARILVLCECATPCTATQQRTLPVSLSVITSLVKQSRLTERHAPVVVRLLRRCTMHVAAPAPSDASIALLHQAFSAVCASSVLKSALRVNASPLDSIIGWMSDLLHECEGQNLSFTAASVVLLPCIRWIATIIRDVMFPPTHLQETSKVQPSGPLSRKRALSRLVETIASATVTAGSTEGSISHGERSDNHGWANRWQPLDPLLTLPEVQIHLLAMCLTQISDHLFWRWLPILVRVKRAAMARLFSFASGLLPTTGTEGDSPSAADTGRTSAAVSASFETLCAKWQWAGPLRQRAVRMGAWFVTTASPVQMHAALAAMPVERESESLVCLSVCWRCYQSAAATNRTDAATNAAARFMNVYTAARLRAALGILDVPVLACLFLCDWRTFEAPLRQKALEVLQGHIMQLPTNSSEGATEESVVHLGAACAAALEWLDLDPTCLGRLVELVGAAWDAVSAHHLLSVAVAAVLRLPNAVSAAVRPREADTSVLSGLFRTAALARVASEEQIFAGMESGARQQAAHDILRAVYDLGEKCRESHHVAVLSIATAVVRNVCVGAQWTDDYVVQNIPEFAVDVYWHDVLWTLRFMSGASATAVAAAEDEQPCSDAQSKADYVKHLVRRSSDAVEKLRTASGAVLQACSNALMSSAVARGLLSVTEGRPQLKSVLQRPLALWEGKVGALVHHCESNTAMIMVSIAHQAACALLSQTPERWWSRGFSVSASGSGGPHDVVAEDVFLTHVHRAMQAIRVLFALCSAEGSDDLHAVEKVASSFTNTMALNRIPSHLFVWLHLTLKRLQFEGDVHHATCSAPPCPALCRQWLMSIAVMASFLGDRLRTVFPKLPAVLQFCGSVPELQPYVAFVWKHVAFALPKEYLAKHFASIVAELLSWCDTAFEHPGIQLSLERVFEITSAKVQFWQVVSHYLRERTNALHRADALPESSKLRALIDVHPLAPVPTPSIVVTGVLTGVVASSTTAKTLFLRILAKYHPEEYPDWAEGMRRSAEWCRWSAEGQRLTHILVECLTTQVPQLQLLASKSVGLVPVQSVGSDRDSSSSSSGNRGSASAAGASSSSALVDDSGGGVPTSPPWSFQYYLNWRELVRWLLLATYHRALANVSDATLHDRAALCVQSVLRAAVRREREDDGGIPLRDGDQIFADELRRYSWWSTLGAEPQQALLPYTSTRYSPIVVTARAFSTLAFDPRLSYAEWLFSWFCILVERARTCPSIVPTCELILPARNVAKKDVVMLEFITSHLIVEIVADNSVPVASNVFHSVVDELRAVLVSTSAGVAAHQQCALRVLESLERCVQSCRRVLRKLDKPLSKLSERDATTFVRRTEVLLQSLCDPSAGANALRTRVTAAVHAGVYAKALRAVESEAQCSLQNVATWKGYALLHTVFSELDDQDSALEISANSDIADSCSSTFRLDPQVLERDHKYSEAIDAIEQGVKIDGDEPSIEHQLCLARCLLKQGQFHVAARYAFAASKAGVAGDGASGDLRMKALANEAAWRLSDWDRIVPFTAQTVDQVSLAEPMMQLVSFGKGCSASNGVQDITASTDALRRVLLDHLVGINTEESLARVGKILGQLRALALIDAIGVFVQRLHPTDVSVQSDIVSLYEELRRISLDSVEAGSEAQRTLMSIMEVVFRSLDRADMVSAVWVNYSRVLRKLGRSQEAYAALQQAHQTQLDERWYADVAKLTYAKSPSEGRSVATSLAAVATIPASATAKLLRYLGTWTAEAAPLTLSRLQSEIRPLFDRSLQLATTEKSLVELAQLYDRGQEAARAAPAHLSRHDHVPQQQQQQLSDADEATCVAAEHYSRALLMGSKYSYLSLPRLLTLWLESAAVSSPTAATTSGVSSLSGVAGGMFSSDTSTAQRKAQDAVQMRLNATIVGALLRGGTSALDESGGGVAVRVVMQALPQLLSRLGHPGVGVAAILGQLLTKLLRSFPYQVLWQLLPVVRSVKQPKRADSAKNDVLGEFTKLGKAEGKMVEQMQFLFSTLLDICNAPPDTFQDPRARLTAAPFMKKAEKVIAGCNCPLPISAALFPDWLDAAVQTASFPTFVGFMDKVEVMSSLQKPKRVTALGSDGAAYSFLCKAKDDPRKDIRMMEIVNLMNRLFLRDCESRRRLFSLRRYVVAALGDDYAIIEWVANQGALRRIVDEAYQLDGTGIRTSAVRELLKKVEQKTLTRRELFTKHILVEAKPVFHQWFQYKFPDATTWYQARVRYTRSIALWSAVGHVVGLGDRHGENILIDQETGEAMHVDFACLFDKGEELGEPERVRFRLTQNLVDAMGILGTAGPFRAAFEIALRTQTRNKAAIMSVLETLLHDPLMEWSTDKAKRDPKKLFLRVRRRLDGYLDFYNQPQDTTPMSVEQQTTKLLEHSSSLENLSMMYIWWMAWI